MCDDVTAGSGEQGAGTAGGFAEVERARLGRRGRRGGGDCCRGRPSARRSQQSGPGEGEAAVFSKTTNAMEIPREPL